MLAELKPLRMENFPEHWEELYVMSFVRVNGYIPLKRIKNSWEDLHDPEGLKTNLNHVVEYSDNMVFRKKIFQV